jgi:hypothetical protein
MNEKLRLRVEKGLTRRRKERKVYLIKEHGALDFPGAFAVNSSSDRLPL